MRYQVPTTDDQLMWDLHLTEVVCPSITGADEAGVFESLAKSPAAPRELAARLQLNSRAVATLLPLLASLGLLVQRLGQYFVTESTRNFLLKESPYYWGPVFTLLRRVRISHESVLEKLHEPDADSRWDLTKADTPVNAWSEGHIAPEFAKAIAAYMHANCLPAALVAAQRLNVHGVRRLLDIGAGSGCFSITLAHANPALRCTLMDLQGMCDVAVDYVREAELQDRIDTCAVDMFRGAWPRGYDAMLFSNIYHDWNRDTCAGLTAKAYESLLPGGKIFLHEMLLNDSYDGPTTATAFSMYMLLGTKGQQFTALELKELLTEAGFLDIAVTPAHSSYAIVSGRKP